MMKFSFIYIKSVWIILLSSLLLIACEPHTIYRTNKSLDNKIWSSNNTLKFNVPINDTTKKYNFFINIRNSSDYSFMNLFVFMTTLYPNGQMSKDTIEFILSRPDGKWLGKGRSIIDNKILLKQNIIFTQKGIYSFEFVQAMREEELKGIEDFGIQLETVK